MRQKIPHYYFLHKTLSQLPTLSQKNEGTADHQNHFLLSARVKAIKIIFPYSSAIISSALFLSRMSSITLYKSTEISPIQNRRTQNRRILNPTVGVVILSCIFLLGRIHNSVGAVESPTGITPKQSAALTTTTTFLRKKTPFAKQRKSMSTRSGTRYRGGAATGPTEGNSEGGTPSTEVSKPSSADSIEQSITPPTTDSTPAAPSNADASTAETTKSSFSWRNARRTLFPIHGKDEVEKFLLIGSIKFFIIMALTLTRDTKDTLIVTQCGAEAIAFLKVRASIITK